MPAESDGTKGAGRGAVDWPSERLTTGDGLIALAYTLPYVGYLYWRPESEAAHWITMGAARRNPDHSVPDVSRCNLLACVVLHSLINVAPAMTMIHFGR